MAESTITNTTHEPAAEGRKDTGPQWENRFQIEQSLLATIYNTSADRLIQVTHFDPDMLFREPSHRLLVRSIVNCRVAGHQPGMHALASTISKHLFLARGAAEAIVCGVMLSDEGDIEHLLAALSCDPVKSN